MLIHRGNDNDLCTIYSCCGGDSDTSILDVSGNFWVGGQGTLRKVTAGGDVSTPIFHDDENFKDGKGRKVTAPDFV